MNKIITPLLYNRPDYTRLVLDALRRCDGVGEYTILAHIDPGNNEVLQLAQSIDFASVEITQNPERLGITQSTYRAWQSGFTKADFIVHIEDDTVPARDCLRYMEHCCESYREDQSIFSVSAYNRSPCRPFQLYNISRRLPFTCWILGIWKDRWEWVKEKWSSDPDAYAPNLTNYLSAFELSEIFPLLSRCQNIGVEKGTHVFSAEWHRRNQHTEYWAGDRDIPPGKYVEEGPLVTAVMVTGLHKERYPFARAAIECFKKQTYANKELLIVNHGGESLFCGDQRIQELRLVKHQSDTVGDLRNIGLSCARGDFVINWDDDDWHHPRRIELQMASQIGEAAVLLLNRVHCNLENGCAYYNRMPGGAAATILHPRAVPFRYPSLVRGSDTEFANMFSKRLTIRNDPMLYVRFYHGLNLWDAEHIMGRLAHPELCNEMQVSEEHKGPLRKLLSTYRKLKAGAGAGNAAPKSRRKSKSCSASLRHLILVPSGGMCNRLRAIASARRLCRRFGAKCSVFWEWGNFNNLYTQPSHGIDKKMLA